MAKGRRWGEGGQQRPPLYTQSQGVRAPDPNGTSEGSRKALLLLHLTPTSPVTILEPAPLTLTAPAPKSLDCGKPLPCLHGCKVMGLASRGPGLLSQLCTFLAISSRLYICLLQQNFVSPPTDIQKE